MKTFRVLAQSLTGEEEKHEFFVEADNEDDAKKLAFDKMLAREADGALLENPAQMFTADEVTFNPHKISDLIDNIEFYIEKMRSTRDMDVVPEMLRQYAQGYFKDVPLDDKAVQALALFTMDKTYRISASLEIMDNYTRAYYAKVIPHFWDYLHSKGQSIFYIVDNTFRNDGKFEAVTELFALTGIAVIAPYGADGPLPYEEVEREIKRNIDEKRITLYIEKDATVNYLDRVKELGVTPGYLTIYRSKASVNPNVEILGN